MPEQLDTIINELRGMREDMQRLGDSLLPNNELLAAAIPIANRYEPEWMSGLPDSSTVPLPVGHLRQLVAAIANQ